MSKLSKAIAGLSTQLAEANARVDKAEEDARIGEVYGVAESRAEVERLRSLLDDAHDVVNPYKGRRNSAAWAEGCHAGVLSQRARTEDALKHDRIADAEIDRLNGVVDTIASALGIKPGLAPIAPADVADALRDALGDAADKLKAANVRADNLSRRIGEAFELREAIDAIADALGLTPGHVPDGVAKLAREFITKGAEMQAERDGALDDLDMTRRELDAERQRVHAAEGRSANLHTALSAFIGVAP